MFIIQRIVVYQDKKKHFHSIYARNRTEALKEKSKAQSKGFDANIIVRSIHWPEAKVVQCNSR